MVKEELKLLKTSKKAKVRVKLREIQGNLNIFRGKERVKHEIYEKEGKVRVKIVSEISKSGGIEKNL